MFSDCLEGCRIDSCMDICLCKVCEIHSFEAVFIIIIMKRLLLATMLIFPVLYAQAKVEVTNMKICNLSTPIGIDCAPVFSWQTISDERGFVQTAYELNLSDIDGNTIWTTGKVESAQQSSITYNGTPLKSRTQYQWSVRVYGQNGEQSPLTTASFETAFMSPDEWSAQWIGDSPDTIRTSYTIQFDKPVANRYVKIDITKLGLPVATEKNLYYCQLAEVEIWSEGKNIAPSARFTTNSSYTVPGNWALAYINDKSLTGSHYGYTTYSFSTPDTHVWIQADLGKIVTIDRIVMYPRQDQCSSESSSHAANFPRSFTIQTSDDKKNYTICYTADDIAAPSYHHADTSVPCYGKEFDVEKTVRRARIYATALGVFNMKLNGEYVTDNRLEPGESEYTKSVQYSTYDVTDKVSCGRNVLTSEVAGGIFNITKLGGNAGLTARYSKEISNHGDCCLKAELHIEYDDGTADIIKTDGSWRVTPSATTGSNWWGGEDYDARIVVGTDNLAQWKRVKTVESPRFDCGLTSGPVGTLISRRYEPIRVVKTWDAKSVTAVHSGGKTVYVVDFGRNYAGTFRFKLKGKQGQAIALRTGSQLNADGSIKQETFNSWPYDIYDTYTFAGTGGTETWGPEFMYHGFRYLQITGLDKKPQPSDFTAMLMRADVEEVGEFSTDNQLINDIHSICRDAIEAQIYNAFTDCPHREKLGWLDVPNEMFYSIGYNYDMRAFWSKVTMDCFDAQYPSGKVPSTVPHYHGDWDDDPNWGGSAIFLPYRNWKRFGDTSLMSSYYPQMKKLIDYYTGMTNGYIMPGKSYSALSDWGQGSAGLTQETTPEFTITTTYYFLLNAMSEMAAYLGHDADAYEFATLASNVKNAFNARFFKNGIYEYGNQGEYGMALYYGLVEEENQSSVARALADRVTADNYKIKTGEIALKPVLMSLAKYGYNDVVYKMANQTDFPSYGYWVKNGCTTTPELWNMQYSQIHCMMDHIEEWFYQELGGIHFDDDNQITIRPFITQDLNKVNASTSCIQGRVAFCYTRKTSSLAEYLITIPANATARIYFPCPISSIKESGKKISVGKNGVLSVSTEGKVTVVEVGSGEYVFTASDEGTTSIKSQTQSNQTHPVAYSLLGIKQKESALRSVSVVRNGARGYKVLKH